MKESFLKFAKNISLQIVSLSLVVGFVAFAATTITGLNQNVSTGDVITSTWYNVVNKALGGPHTEGGICSYTNGKIMCNNTNNGTTNTNGGIECVKIEKPQDIVKFYKMYSTPDNIKIEYKYLSSVTVAGPNSKHIDNSKVFTFIFDVKEEYSQGTFAMKDMNQRYRSDDGQYKGTLNGSPDDLGNYSYVHSVGTPIIGEKGIRIYKFLSCGPHNRDCPWGGTDGSYKQFEKYELTYCNKP